MTTPSGILTMAVRILRRLCTLAFAGYIKWNNTKNSGHLSADRWRTHSARTKIIPPIPQKTFPKFRNSRKTFENTSVVRPKIA